MKTIFKLFLTPDKLAKWSASGIQTAINQSKYKDEIAKYGDMANRFTEVQKWLTEVLKDGKVDELERTDIEAKLKPVFQKLIELI